VPGLAKINPQDGHIILEDLSEGRTSMYIFRMEGGGLYSIERRYLQTVTGSRPY